MTFRAKRPYKQSFPQICPLDTCKTYAKIKLKLKFKISSASLPLNARVLQVGEVTDNLVLCSRGVLVQSKYYVLFSCPNPRINIFFNKLFYDIQLSFAFEYNWD
jgi:hypothetical protein